MEQKHILRPAPLYFGAATGLAVYMFTGLPAAAAALFFCTLFGLLTDNFGKAAGFVPGLAGLLGAVVFHGRFMAECARCADEAAYLAAVKAHALYEPVTGGAESAWLVLLCVCGIACGIYAAAGAKACCVLAAVLGAAGDFFLLGRPMLLCPLVAAGAAVCCFGEDKWRGLPLSVLTVLLALPAVWLKPPAAAAKGEVKAAAGLPLYLAEEYEDPALTKSGYERASGIFAALYEHGFDPRLQTELFLEAAGSDLERTAVTAPRGFTPQNVCSGETSRKNTDGFAGESYTVCPQLDENVFALMGRLTAGDYLDCEALYREYVFSAYGTLTAEEQSSMEERFAIDGSQPLDRKLAAVRSGVNAKLGSEEERTSLTVTLARSCGIAAREVKGVYFKAVPAGGVTDLKVGQRRSWAEVYIDGAGWVVFETRPEYVSASPLLPEGVSDKGGESSAEGAESYIYAAAPPRTAAEIRSPEEKADISAKWLLLLPAALLCILLAGRFRAAARALDRKSKTPEKALTAAHRQGRELLLLVTGADKDLPPEELAGQTEGLLRKRFAESQRAYDSLRFSGRGADEKSADTAKKFYAEALRASKKQGRGKSLVRRLKGLY
ncbi:transglutaminase-like domain-containing protein [Ruminococcus sp.]|uniref:transglutaminase-like domain-containing protein n=1 Tax=Ruminococcus sp. TaxID=41978 RepID=UPI0025F85AF8|nr:transglutaminase-like domain-containing protein [Ruminococcus sp.]MBQ8965568.1 transglutaminase domain-containing protein [Ruminococcus sp.]